MFVFNEDGTIAGLKEVQPVSLSPNAKPKGKSGKGSDVGGDKKFGALSSQMSAISMAETKVAFSDANYTPGVGQEEGARIGNMRGKPGIELRNLLLVPGTLFFSLLTGADVMQSMTQILKNPEYYNKGTEDAGNITANSLTYA